MLDLVQKARLAMHRVLEGDSGKWVTINGTHVQLDGSGNIVAGPKHMTGKKPDELGKGPATPPSLSKSKQTAKPTAKPAQKKAAVNPLGHHGTAEEIDARGEGTAVKFLQSLGYEVHHPVKAPNPNFKPPTKQEAAPEPKAKPKAKKPENMSLLAVVRREGGISSGDFDHADFKEFGLLGALNKKGFSLDDMAATLVRQGHIPEAKGASPGDHLLQLLKQKTTSLLADKSKQYEDEYAQYLAAQQEALADGHSQEQLGEIQGSESQAGQDQGGAGFLDEIFGGDGSRGEEEGGGEGDAAEPASGEVDTSFDFGQETKPKPEPTPEDTQAQTIKDALGLEDKPAPQGDIEHTLRNHPGGWMTKADIDAIAGPDARRQLEEAGQLAVGYDAQGQAHYGLKGRKMPAGLMTDWQMDGMERLGFGKQTLAPDQEKIKAGFTGEQPQADVKAADPDYKAPKGFKVPKSDVEYQNRLTRAQDDHESHGGNINKIMAAQAEMPQQDRNGQFFIKDPETGKEMYFGRNPKLAKQYHADYLKSRLQIVSHRHRQAKAEVANLRAFSNAHDGDPWKPKTPPAIAQANPAQAPEPAKHAEPQAKDTAGPVAPPTLPHKFNPQTGKRAKRSALTKADAGGVQAEIDRLSQAMDTPGLHRDEWRRLYKQRHHTQRKLQTLLAGAGGTGGDSAKPAAPAPAAGLKTPPKIQPSSGPGATNPANTRPNDVLDSVMNGPEPESLGKYAPPRRPDRENPDLDKAMAAKPSAPPSLGAKPGSRDNPDLDSILGEPSDAGQGRAALAKFLANKPRKQQEPNESKIDLEKIKREAKRIASEAKKVAGETKSKGLHDLSGKARAVADRAQKLATQ